MSMNVIDCSDNNAALSLPELEGVNFDGVAIKATQGTGYVNPDCDKIYQQAKAMGKKRAVYHYANGAGAVAEANYFVDNCIGYIRDAIFVLDWEGSGVQDVAYALAFLQQVEARIGYKPAIYMSMSVENDYDWSPVVANNNGLWIARYSNWELANHADNFDMSNAGQAPILKHWPFYFMWQWTSTGLLSGYAGNLDCDIAYLTQAQWDAYAGVQATPAPTTQSPATTTTTTTEVPTTTSTTTQPASDSSPTTNAQTTQTDAPVVTTTTQTQSVPIHINDPVLPTRPPILQPPVVTTTTTHRQVIPPVIKSDVEQGVSLLEAVALRAINTFWQSFVATFGVSALGLVSAALSIHTFSDAKSLVISLVVAVVAAALSAIKNVIKPPVEVE